MSVEFLEVVKFRSKPLKEYSGKHWAKRKALRFSLKYGTDEGHEKKITRHARDTAASSGTLAAEESVRKAEADSMQAVTTSRITAEWIGATGGPPAEVVLRLHPASPATPRLNLSTSDTRGGSGVVVRTEEALIVTFVLLLWIAAIALFFNRWGKIRMLEPYQPKFQQQHRTSCAHVVDNVVSVPPLHRASIARGCMSYDCSNVFPAYQPCAHLAHRPRQNSVFVGSVGAMTLIPESPPRRSRSAADLPALVTPPAASNNPSARSSRAASLHSAVDLRICVPSPRTYRTASLHSAMDVPAAGSVQVHARGSTSNMLARPRSPRPLRIVTNV